MQNILRYVTPVGVGILCIPATGMISTGVVFAKDGDERFKKIDLSIYDDLHRSKSIKLKIENTNSTELEKIVAKCRQTIVPIKDTIVQYTGQVITKTKDTTDSVTKQVKYLQTSAPIELKFGTIFGSGILGMLLGFRRGVLRKLFYGILGSGTAFSIIYPGDAKIIAGQGTTLTKQYAVIAYHFVVGAQPVKKECEKKISKDKLGETPATVIKKDCECENTVKN